jgi:hypothetical protein
LNNYSWYQFEIHHHARPAASIYRTGISSRERRKGHLSDFPNDFRPTGRDTGTGTDGKVVLVVKNSNVLVDAVERVES